VKQILLITCFIISITTEIFGIRDTLTFTNPAFSENKGQWPEQVLYKAQLSNGNLWIEKNCLTFDIQNSEDVKAIAKYKWEYGQNQLKGIPLPDKIRKHSFKINFLDANPDANHEGIGVQYDYENYFLGNNPNKWATDVKKYSYTFIRNIYNGIDLKIYGNDGFLKWDFILKSKANPKQIKLEYEGVNDISLISGNLVLKTNAGKIIEMKPAAWQYNSKGEQISIECSFKIQQNQVSFELGQYDITKELIIDPILVYASYTGSTADNWGYTATYDNYGNIIAGGAVFSSGYPLTLGAYDQSFNGVCDIGITKFDPTSSLLIYSTYIGGSHAEVPSSLMVNTSNELLILSITSSTNFPVNSAAFDTTFNGGTSIALTGISFTNGSDIALTRLSSSGNQLLGSTYYGGSANDGFNSATILDHNYADMVRGEILTDKNNNVYVVSSTKSTNLPVTANALQPSNAGLQDGLIAKFDNNLSNLIWASYFGGNSDDAIYSVSLFKNEDLAIAGGTKSINLPTSTGVLQTSYNGGSADGFVATLSKNGNQIFNLSYFGRNGYDQAYFVDIDRKDNVYLYGQTNDTTNFFIQNALFSTPSGGQFVSKLTMNLDSIIWSTNWGTAQITSPSSTPASPDISPSAFMVDLCNRVYMSGWGGQTNNYGTTSGLPITPGAFQSTTDGSDYYFITIKDDASALDYATFYGGTQSHEHVDGGTSRFDNTGKLYQSVCAGCGNHDDFPTTTGCHSALNNSNNCNNAVIKFSFSVPVVVADFNPPMVGCAPYQIQFTNTSYVTSTHANYLWNFGNGNTSSAYSPIYTYTQGGVYNVTLIITDTSSCNLGDTITKQVAVIEGHRDTLTPKEICIGDFIQIGLLPINDPNLTYQWNNGTSLSNTTISNPIASPSSSIYYTLLFSNGICTDTLVQQVKVYDIKANAGNDTTLCFSTIKLTASSNYSNLNFIWSNNANFTNVLNASKKDSTIVTTVTGPTWFYLKVYKDNSCYDIDSVLVEPRILVSINQQQNPKCYNDNNGFISLNITGGSSPYTYHWSSGHNTDTINNLQAGVYNVTVTDDDGCYALSQVTLVDPQPLTSNTAIKNIPCQNACIGEAWATPNGGTLPYQWQWNDAATQTNNPATNLCDGDYAVTITDANQCVIYDTVTIIDSSIYIIPNAWIAKDTIYEGQSVQIHSNYYGINYHYSWTPSTGLNNSNIYNPTASPNYTTTYYLTITDQYGCVWFDSIFIYVIDVICEEPYVFVPNAFTPDGDGKNDILYVRSSVGYEMEFRIFNRWGEIVYESFNKENGWDGSFKGKKLEPGVFDYYLIFTCYNREIFTKKGNITLIR
jgi:gliding motility-associated-like protein